MERDFAGARLSPDAFRTLAGLCRGDKRFPTRYEDWEALVRDGTRQAKADGRPTDEVLIDADAFLDWCRKVAILPCFDALRAYLIIARRGDDPLGRSASTERDGPAGDREGGDSGHRTERAALAGAVLRGMVRTVAARIGPRPAAA